MLQTLLVLISVNLFVWDTAQANDVIAEECAKANIGSVSDMLGSSAPSYIEMSTEQEIASRYGTGDIGTWALAMYPSPKGRMGGVLGQIMLIQNERERYDADPKIPLQQYFEKSAQTKPVLSNDDISFIHQHFDSWRSNTYYDSQLKSFKAGAPYFCGYFSLFGCVGPVNKVLDWMHPHVYSSWSVSLVDLWEKVFLDTEYYPGLSKGASIVFQRISEIRARRNFRAPTSDIFTDLVAGYRAVGKPEAEAKARALDILALYSTRGAHTGAALSVSSRGTISLVASLAFISSAMSYLDMVQPEGRYYSLPPSTTGTCKYGKPYHFWMGAYFVEWLLSARDLSRKEAAIASHIVGRVYESNSNTYGRDADQAFYEKLLSLHNNAIRANLVINDAGVVWAAQEGKQVFNVNAAIELLKSKAVELPAMSPSELKELLKKPIERDKAWIQMFAPDVLINQWLARTRV